MSASELMERDDWITIATPGCNKNQRTYTPEALAAMAKDLPGLPVMDAASDGLAVECDFRAMRGIVTASRQSMDRSVEVRVHWFTGARPIREMFLTPCGRGLIAGNAQGYHWVTGYSADCLMISDNSAFEGASQMKL